MSPRRIGVLFLKDLFHGTKTFLIISIIAPVVLTLLVNLIFGSIVQNKPELAVFDQGSSQLVSRLKEKDSLITREYGSDRELKDAVASGTIDMGLVLTGDFDNQITSGEISELTVYIWGESLIKNRLILASVITSVIRDLSGNNGPFEVVPVSLGDEEAIPWKDRLMPLVVLISVLMGGFFIPSTSLVSEKQKQTIGALLITPATSGEVFLAKGLLGFCISMIMGVMILLMNRVFGSNPGLLLLLTAMGALLTVCIGLMLGAVMKDLMSLFSAIKGLGLFLYGPAIVYMFPQIPQWIGKLFPTYYLVNPINVITQKSGGWPDIALDVLILAGFLVVFMILIGLIIRKKPQDAG